MGFDIEAAKQAGYTDEEIKEYLASKPPAFDVTADQFDVKAALKAGYTEEEIAQHLASKNIGQVQQPQPAKVRPKKDFIDSMSTPDKFLVGVGKGMMDVGYGASQLALQGAELFGLDPKYRKSLEARADEERRFYKPLSDKSTAANVGEFVGNVAPMAVMPGGLSGGLTKRLATSALSGAAQGALQYTGENESKVQNALVGGALGAAGQVIGSGVAKVANTIKKPVMNETQKLSQKFGIRTTLGEIKDNPLIKRVEVMLEQVPLRGLKTFRKLQQKEAESAAKDFFGQYVFDPSLSTTAAMKESNDAMIDNLFEAVRKTGSKLPSVEPASIKQATTGILDQYPEIFESIQDGHLKKILKNIVRDTRDETVDTGILNVKGQPIIREEPVMTDFNDLWTLRKGLGKEIKDAKTDTARGVYKQLYASVSNDMENMFAQSGTAIGKEFTEANEAFKRYSVKFDVLREAYDKSMGTIKGGDMEKFSPRKFATELKNLANDPRYKKWVKWEKNEVEEMTGLAKILEVTKRAGQYTEDVPTGNRWGLPTLSTGLGTGAAYAGGVAGVAKTALGAGAVIETARFLTSNPVGKRLALAASKVEPESYAMYNIVKMIPKLMSQFGLEATEQPTGDLRRRKAR